MKILVVIPNLVMGGAERLTVYLLKYMDRKNFQLALCLFENKGELLKEVPRDVQVFSLGKKNRWSFLNLIKQFNKIINAYKPDIVYTRMWYATTVVAFSKVFFKKRYLIIANEEHNHKRDVSAVEKLGFFKKQFMNWAHKKASLVLVPSKGVKKELVESYLIKYERIKVVYNSVDFKMINDSLTSKKITFCQNANKELPTIVAFGRLIKRKGFDDLLKAFRIIRREMKASLIVVGEGKERSNLQDLARKLFLNEVIFTGFLENPYVVLSQADIFVLSSHWEGFGNVIIEAMACGVPVISTRCSCGPDEIVTDGVNGLLVPVGDIEAMAEAILKLLEDKPLRKRLAEAGRRRAEDFRVEKMVAEYEKVFEGAIFAE